MIDALVHVLVCLCLCICVYVCARRCIDYPSVSLFSAGDRYSREAKTIPKVRQEQEFAAWKIDIAELAQCCKNVHVKLSGLAMPFMLPIRDFYDNRKSSVEV